MYVITFIYPTPKSRAFDHDYLRDVHVPMGIAMVSKYLGVEPEQAWTERVDDGGPHAAVVHLMFARRQDRDVVPRIGDFAEVQAVMGGDYDNYTDTPPSMHMSEWTATNIAASIQKYANLTA